MLLNFSYQFLLSYSYKSYKFVVYTYVTIRKLASSFHQTYFNKHITYKKRTTYTNGSIILCIYYYFFQSFYHQPIGENSSIIMKIFRVSLARSINGKCEWVPTIYQKRKTYIHVVFDYVFDNIDKFCVKSNFLNKLECEAIWIIFQIFSS